MTAKAYTVKSKSNTQPVVVMEAEVARKIRQHARSSMKAEVCGILIGNIDNSRTLIDACIAGVNAAQGGAHVTFTQDTWEHIYKIKDQQYPEEKIVGWYHSHPGFGVFLSEHDLFIQENFFSSPQQVAWVYDPHTDEEGCFGWVGGKTEKLSGLRFGYSQSVATTSSNVAETREEGDEGLVDQVRIGPDRGGSEPAWVTWTLRIAGYLAALVIGFALGHEYLAWRIRPEAEAMEQKLMQASELLQQCQPEFNSCVVRLTQEKTALSPAPVGAEPGNQKPRQPSQPQPQVTPPAGKGSNGKH
jgi:proteasome lid subunit RPN8/RPN11